MEKPYTDRVKQVFANVCGDFLSEMNLYAVS